MEKNLIILFNRVIYNYVREGVISFFATGLEEYPINLLFN
jgi:hypothetical protein